MPVISDEEFLRVELENGVSAENPAYVSLMRSTAEYLMLIVKPDSVLEIGSGTGVFVREMMLIFGDSFTMPSKVIGIEPSKCHYEYAHRHSTHPVTLVSPTEAFEYVTDYWHTIVSIEVFEHLTDAQIVQYLDTFKSKYFLLTSTPYATTPEQDEAWGHINIKQPHEWEEIFAMYGYKVKDRPRIPTEWAILFEHV